MHAVILAGGYGGARFAIGMRDQLAASADRITVIVNTADDIRIHGLQISPDLDTVMYTLGGGLDTDRGWGRQDEAFRANEELTAYGAPASWFGLGDRDLATHLIRTQMREAGYGLTEVTAALCKRWDPGATILPMTDDRVETHVVVDIAGERRAIHFQEWWIRHRAEVPTHEFVQVGLDQATPTGAVNGAIADADVILLAPSNPVVSLGPILGVPGLGPQLTAARAPIIGISPIVGGRALRGMADICLRVVGADASATGVAKHYDSRRTGGLLDAWIIDRADADSVPDIGALGIKAVVADTIMSDADRSRALAEVALTVADGINR